MTSPRREPGVGAAQPPPICAMWPPAHAGAADYANTDADLRRRPTADFPALPSLRRGKPVGG